MKERLAKLIDLKSIITLAITVALIYGFFANKIDGKDFLVYVTMVYTFYFTKRKEKGDEWTLITEEELEIIKSEANEEQVKCEEEE